MHPFRPMLAALAALFLMLAACKTTGDWYHPASPLEDEDLKQYSVQESLEFYRGFYPPRGYYLIVAVREVDEPAAPHVYSFVVFRLFDVRLGGKIVPPQVERIIGPVATQQEWTDLFSIFRRYSSSPPAGYYCWQNDCHGKYNPPGEPERGDPYPPDLPGQPPTSLAVGYGVVPVGGADGGVVLLEDELERARQLAANGTGGSTVFTPRTGTRITAGYVQELRSYAERVQKSFLGAPIPPPAPTAAPSRGGAPDGG